jgi:DNA repair exonuclease SbcCD ATPase subunit
MTAVLKTMNQDEVNPSLPTSESTPKSKQPLTEFLVTKQQLTHIQDDLNRMINAGASNPSLFSRASIYWGTLTLWQKISIGAILIAPTFIAGIAASIAGLVSISLFTLFTYTASSMLMDDHQAQNTTNTGQLRRTISSLIGLLTTVIDSLDLLCERLTSELDKFQKENEQLSEHVSNLSEQVDEVTIQVKQLQDTEHKLRLTQRDLEKTASSLQDTIQEQSKLLQKSQKELEQAIERYESVHVELSKKIVELSDVKAKMELQVEKAKRTSITLQGVVEQLSRNIIADEQQRIAFQKRLEEFLNNKEKSFDQIADRICDAEQKLAEMTEAYKLCNQRYQDLLDRQEQQVDRLTRIDSTSVPQTPKKQISNAKVMKNIGLHAFEERKTQPSNEALPHMQTLQVY